MSATTITHVDATEILDSRDNPTLAVTVHTEAASGTFGVPSGASTGTHEALELRDGDPKRYGGMGVLKAVAAVNGEVRAALVGMDAVDQRAVDTALIALDGTPNKSRLGGNAIVGASVATAKAAAAAQDIALTKHLQALAPTITPSASGRAWPYLGMNLINGGKHAATRLAFQEYKIIPVTDDIDEALNIGTSILDELRKELIARYGASSANVGDEGGFAPDLTNIREPLELFMAVAQRLGMDQRIRVALDVAATSFWNGTTYAYDSGEHTADELAETLRGIVRDFPVVYIEDPFHEEAFADFASLMASLKDAGAPLIVGDDLTVTNTDRLGMAIAQRAINAVIIKVNQVGTLTETLDTMRLARKHGVECIVSHRSGETNDSFIADLAVAFKVFGIKAGGPQRGERIAKYNRLKELLS